MSEITEFMNTVKEFAVDHNIDFILMTNEGSVSNGIVDYISREREEEQKELQKHNPNCKDLAKIYTHLYNQEMRAGLLKGSPLDNYTEPAVYIKLDIKRNKYYIMVMYEDVSYDVFEVTWYVTGWKPTLDNYKIGIMSFRIMNNQLIELMKQNNNFTEEVVGKEVVMLLNDDIDRLSIFKALPWNLNHVGSLKVKWEKIIDSIVESIQFSVEGFYSNGTL